MFYRPASLCFAGARDEGEFAACYVADAAYEFSVDGAFEPTRHVAASAFASYAAPGQRRAMNDASLPLLMSRA